MRAAEAALRHHLLGIRLSGQNTDKRKRDKNRPTTHIYYVQLIEFSSKSLHSNGSRFILYIIRILTFGVSLSLPERSTALPPYFNSCLP